MPDIEVDVNAMYEKRDAMNGLLTELDTAIEDFEKEVQKLGTEWSGDAYETMLQTIGETRTDYEAARETMVSYISTLGTMIQNYIDAENSGTSIAQYYGH